MNDAANKREEIKQKKLRVAACKQKTKDATTSKMKKLMFSVKNKFKSFFDKEESSPSIP